MNKTNITKSYLSDSNKNFKLQEDVVVKGKDLGTYRLYHYTTAHNANEILKSGEFWLSRFRDMNDKNEAKLHENDGKNVFCLSFCSSNTEKIPLWYLYSGIVGKGVSIAFTPGTMAKFINSIQKCELFKKQDRNKILKEIGIDGLEIECGWVLYRKNGAGEVFYRNKWCLLENSENESDVTSLEKDKYFVKDYPWEYEREFRIVIKLTNIDNALLGEEDLRIAVKIPDEIYKDIKIKTAPEFENASKLFEQEGFKKWAEAKKELEKSSLDISMDLLGRNKKDVSNLLIDKFDDFVEKKQYGILCGKIAEKEGCKEKKSNNT